MFLRSIAKPSSVLCLLFAATLAGATDPDTLPLPKVFCADPHAMAAAKAKLAAGDNSLKPALNRLLRDANHALEIKPPSVMDKRRVPPSGDKHDYVSQAPYFWADTN